jgi:iron(III) transport system substrate-binding protein
MVTDAPRCGLTTRSRGRRIAGLVGAVAVVALACLPLSACGTGDAANTITLYSGQHEQTSLQLIAAFEQKTHIRVVFRSDDEDVLADQIAAEGSRSLADVFLTENSPPLMSLQHLGLLAKLDPATLAATPARFSSPQGYWVGVSARVSVLIYNPSLISASQLPTQVSQLADARYRGKLAIAPTETDFQPIVTAYLRAYGKAATLAWLKAINANAAGHVYPDNETVATDVNRGQAAFGIINQYYWYRLRAVVGRSNMDSRIAYFEPGDPGYVIDVSGAAVLKSSKHQADAQKFVAFLVSRQAQEILATPGTGPGQSLSFEYPIASGVTTRAGEKPFDQLRPYPITIAELGTGTTAIALLREAGLI